VETPFMRAHHVIATAAVILVAFGAKLFFFSVPAAEADIHAVLHANALPTHSDQPNISNLPEQEMYDMTFVFSDRD
jgi:hypothetical protein